ASARADEPVSEGMVSILEPFIDTIVICTLTGLVILSSGVWSEKHENEFSRTDMVIVEGSFDESKEADREVLYHYFNNTGQESVEKYTGTILVENGRAISNGYTLLHARSIAENVRFIVAGEDPYSGSLRVENGQLRKEDITIIGESLMHSAVLTSVAFGKGYFGDMGEYIVPISLLLFAFSTAIAWSYYGDRAVVYLFGQRGVMPYRIIYVAGFFVASFADTTLVWTLSYVAIVLMTLPNLFGIMLLRREMKDTVKAYWQDFDAEKAKTKETK
ncbi:sodium:alanine symporter family protein, partial [Pseudidiomarina aestuarii]